MAKECPKCGQGELMAVVESTIHTVYHTDDDGQPDTERCSEIIDERDIMVDYLACDRRHCDYTTEAV